MDYKVSFCIPVYNQADVIYKLVKNVLEKSDESFQIVILDDGSEDNIAERMKDITDERLKLVLAAHLGAKPSWYRALENGDGEYLYLVMGRDKLNPTRIAGLIQSLAWAKEKGISVLRDDYLRPYRKYYKGIEAAKEFLSLQHPTGFIIEREAWRGVENREKYFQLAIVHPQTRVIRDCLKKNCKTAYLNNLVYNGEQNYDLASVRAQFDPNKKFYFSPERVTEDYIKVLTMADEFDFSQKECDDFFIAKYEAMLKRVSYSFRNKMRDEVSAAHRGYKVRNVSRAEMIRNMIRSHNTVKRYYGERLSKYRYLEMKRALTNQIKNVILGFEEF